MNRVCWSNHCLVTVGNCYERLIAAFAPSIWQMDDVKRGILCQLFGGTTLSGLVGLAFVGLLCMLCHCMCIGESEKSETEGT